MSVLLARSATFLTVGWIFSAALVVGFVVIGVQEWVASGETSVARVILMILPLAIFGVAFRRRWRQVREDEDAQRELAAGVAAERPRNLHAVDVSLLVCTIRMTAWTLPFWVLWLAIAPLSVGEEPSPLIVLSTVAIGVVLLGVLLLGDVAGGAG